MISMNDFWWTHRLGIGYLDLRHNILDVKNSKDVRRPLSIMHSIWITHIHVNSYRSWWASRNHRTITLLCSDAMTIGRRGSCDRGSQRRRPCPWTWLASCRRPVRVERPPGVDSYADHAAGYNITPRWTPPLGVKRRRNTLERWSQFPHLFLRRVTDERDCLIHTY
jgi:hypothetical protein